MYKMLGVHYIIDFYNCNSTCLSSISKINHIMYEACKIGKLHIVKNCFHQFHPYGVSGVVVLKESHFTVHTWPEHGYAAVDLFLCDMNVNVNDIIEFLCQSFKTIKYDVVKLERGTKTK